MTKPERFGFKEGELAVYPAHGVGVIHAIERRSVAGVQQAFYVLKILDSDATIMIPINNASTVGMRRVMKKSMVDKVYSVLKGRKNSPVENIGQTWNRRYRDYTEKIKTGCVLELAKVLKELYLLKGDKELSFGERRMFDTTRNLLVKEISVAKRVNGNKIEKELDHMIKKCW